MKQFFKENGSFIAIAVFGSLSLIFFLTTLLFGSMCSDLVNVVNVKEQEITELNKEIIDLNIGYNTMSDLYWDLYYSGVTSYDDEYEYYE